MTKPSLKVHNILPNQKEGYKNICILNKKIKNILPKEDFEWVSLLVLSLMGYEEYPEIKKELGDLYIKDLKDNHFFIQKIISEETNPTILISIIKEIKQIISTNKNLCTSLINYSFGRFNNEQEVEEVEYALNMIGYLLCQEDSIIINKAYQLFDERLSWTYDKQYLNEIIEFQKQQIPKILFNYYKEKVTSFNIQKKSLELYEFKEHKEVVYSKYLREERRKTNIRRRF